MSAGFNVVVIVASLNMTVSKQNHARLSDAYETVTEGNSQSQSAQRDEMFPVDA